MQHKDRQLLVKTNILQNIFLSIKKAADNAVRSHSVQNANLSFTPSLLSKCSTKVVNHFNIPNILQSFF
jgi:hypothetical protein